MVLYPCISGGADAGLAWVAAAASPAAWSPPAACRCHAVLALQSAPTLLPRKGPHGPPTGRPFLPDHHPAEQPSPRWPLAHPLPSPRGRAPAWPDTATPLVVEARRWVGLGLALSETDQLPTESRVSTGHGRSHRSLTLLVGKSDPNYLLPTPSFPGLSFSPSSHS